MRTFICKTHKDDGASEHRIKAVKSTKAVKILEAKLQKKIIGYEVLGDYIWYYTK